MRANAAAIADENLYRARYTWPSGEVSHVTFASTPRDALRWAADYCRCFVQGELLSITELRGMQRPLFRLV